MDHVTMPAKNLMDISIRLSCCTALLDAIDNAMCDGGPWGDAVCGVRDLLECIRRDFQADIDCAELEGGGPCGRAEI